MTDDIDDDIPNIAIADILRSLPLCGDLYVGMQAINLGVVDEFLEQEEARLVSEYMRDDAMPWPLFILVSALSQMWIFALYEFLRTWRQRSRDVVEWAKSLQGMPTNERDVRLAAKREDISARAADPDEALAFSWPAYEHAAADPGFPEAIQKAVDRTERLFRRVEVLRIALAKHKIQGISGSRARAPGYARLDSVTGSILWIVSLGGNQVDLISRRRIADECRRLPKEGKCWSSRLPFRRNSGASRRAGATCAA